MKPLDRIVLGAIAGFAATLPMTMAMRGLHARLPRTERYPLPPREISEDLPRPGMSAATAALLYHFLYGGAAGGLYALLVRRRDVVNGSAYGVAVWLASYLGWIPAASILRFGTEHPARRNGLMIVAHLVWGSALALGLEELAGARTESFSRSTSPRSALKDRTEFSR
ncbi:Uncharacterised protein [Starkeya nomas]|uniref:Inner membrane protein YagU n=1 Tax=Starkeya nomas TaxID=2666134 RepID=A0A5S9P0D7_9HYPH|nr:hypothetical protein [Starkeya nomas]CAA0096688.1 Uncharacterised protein [Starkeya nomas]